jgi:hypothetical protein
MQKNIGFPFPRFNKMLFFSWFTEDLRRMQQSVALLRIRGWTLIQGLYMHSPNPIEQRSSKGPLGGKLGGLLRSRDHSFNLVGRKFRRAMRGIEWPDP